MSGHRYFPSGRAFLDEEDDDVADELFLANSRRAPPPADGLQQELAERRRAIEERTVHSTAQSLGLLRESEQIGIATAEELVKQRQQLERTDQRLDEINATLRFSQKHINGIKSVFSGLKNYLQGRSEAAAAPGQGGSKGLPAELERQLQQQDQLASHPVTRLWHPEEPARQQPGGSAEAALQANLVEMSGSISRLKGLAEGLSTELDQQNDLIDNIYNKTDQADLTIIKQNKDMKRLMK